LRVRELRCGDARGTVVVVSTSRKTKLREEPADVSVSDPADRPTQLQVRDPPDLLHEVFLADAVGKGGRAEVSPLVIITKAGGTIAAITSLKRVLSIQRVGCACEEGRKPVLANNLSERGRRVGPGRHVFKCIGGKLYRRGQHLISTRVFKAGTANNANIMPVRESTIVRRRSTNAVSALILENLFSESTWGAVRRAAVVPGKVVND